jgi:hypothetical protein
MLASRFGRRAAGFKWCDAACWTESRVIREAGLDTRIRTMSDSESTTELLVFRPKPRGIREVFLGYNFQDISARAREAEMLVIGARALRETVFDCKVARIETQGRAGGLRRCLLHRPRASREG